MARFVGKENVIYELQLDSEGGTELGARVTLEISVTKHDDTGAVTMQQKVPD